VSQIVILGAGVLGETICYYLTYHSHHEVVAYADDYAYRDKKELGGLPVIPFDTVETIYPPDTFSMIVVIGYMGANQIRAQKYREAKQKGYELITYLDQRSTIEENVEIGDNCIISPNTYVGPFVKIGNNVIIQAGSYIGHHVEIEDNCLLAPHVAVSGSTIIEQSSFLGTNSTIRNNIRIRKGTVVGAGVLILKDTDEFSVYRGAEGQLLPMKSYEIKL